MTAACILLSAIELVAPAQDATVSLVSDGQRAVLTNETLAAREAVFAADRKNGKRIRHDAYWRKPLPVVFRWKTTAGEKGPWEILVSRNPDLSEARQFLFSSAEVDAATGRETGSGKSTGGQRKVLSCLNLEIGTRYYWRVTSDLTCGKFGHARKCDCRNRHPSVSSETGTFVTEDLAPRWIEIEGKVGNFRDLGGRTGLGGKRVRQGMVYRSQGLNNNSVDGIAKGKNRLTVSDVEYLTETLGIRTDLDLRNPVEVAGMDGVSPLGKTVRYVHHPSQCYAGIFTPEGKKTMAKNFRVFLDGKSYPILFHCIGGADRTGALGYVLNGVLGVCRRELETDWESTFYPNIPDQCHPDEPDFWCRESHFNDGFSRYGDEQTSWNERIVLYLKDCGVTDAEIETFRNIMLK